MKSILLLFSYTIIPPSLRVDGESHAVREGNGGFGAWKAIDSLTASGVGNGL